MSNQYPPVEKYSRKYHLLKHYVDFAFRRYYRTELAGIEKIPFAEPLIFAANHQNALIDALALLTVRTWQPVFLARADIFANPNIGAILSFLKMLPVYRLRDGFEKLEKNDAIFRKTNDVLINRNGLVMLPEGNHLGKKRLRQLKKGIARIALQNEELADFKMGIKIVPVGLEFEDYKKVGSRLLIRFGEPIEVATYREKYLLSAAIGVRSLTEALATGLKNQMIHIEDVNFYDETIFLLRLVNSYLRDKPLQEGTNSRLVADKDFIAHIEKCKTDTPDLYNQLIEQTRQVMASGFYNNPPGRFDNFLAQTLRKTMLLITSPLFLVSFVINMLPLAISRFISNRFNDHHFHASIRLVVGMLAFPLFYFLLVLLFVFIVGFNWLLLAWIVSLPLSFKFFFVWKRHFFKFWNYCTGNFARLCNKKEYCETKVKVNKLLQELKNLT
ncbi:MAG TPA: 1-acyl-sn-glycerol-3-phosphate acyltransferase [Bacteroidales bacterium]|nr:1-acyl-sn-glycerol-3-phosphate acyltransferase [Bacteroidales bacterium]